MLFKAFLFLICATVALAVDEVPVDFGNSRPTGPQDISSVHAVGSEKHTPVAPAVVSESLLRASLYHAAHARAERAVAIKKILEGLPTLAGAKDPFGVPVHGGIKDPLEDRFFKADIPQTSDDPESLFPVALRSLRVSVSCLSEGWFGVDGEEIFPGDILTIKYKGKIFRGAVVRIRDGTASVRSLNSDKVVEIEIPSDKDDFVFNADSEPENLVSERRVLLRPPAAGLNQPRVNR